MHRIAKVLALSVMLFAMPWKAQSAESASFQVNLTIRESCLIQAPDVKTREAAPPEVHCLHDAPHLTQPLAAPLVSQDAVPLVTKQTPTTWLVMF